MAQPAETTWQTDVGALVGLYQKALSVLVPIADEARIPWSESDAYDDWDAIAEVLFEQIVCRSIRWALPSADRDLLRLPRYGLSHPDYSELSLLAVSNNASSQISVLHSLGTTAQPFDTVLYVLIDEKGHPVDDRLRRLPLREAKFSFLLRSSSGVLGPLERLEVEL
jgi:hypothetical protein